MAKDAKGSALAGCMGGAMLPPKDPPKRRSLLEFKSTRTSILP